MEIINTIEVTRLNEPELNEEINDVFGTDKAFRAYINNEIETIAFVAVRRMLVHRDYVSDDVLMKVAFHAGFLHGMLFERHFGAMA